MLKKILFVLVALISRLRRCTSHCSQTSYKVERSVTIAAPADKVFDEGQQFAQMGGLVALGQARSRCQDRL